MYFFEKSQDFCKQNGGFYFFCFNALKMGGLGESIQLVGKNTERKTSKSTLGFEENVFFIRFRCFTGRFIFAVFATIKMRIERGRKVR
jgi:hypothetical protein